jgi:hypothetical protein
MCFAFKPNETADCADTVPGDLMPTVRTDQAQNLYPDLFYSAMSRFAGDSSSLSAVQNSVLLMRILNVTVLALGMALVLWLVPATMSRAVILATVVTWVPLGFFTVASVNPSSWSFIGLALLLPFAFGFVTRGATHGPRDFRTWLLGALSIAASTLAIGSRVDAGVYVSVVVLVAVVLAGRANLRAAWWAALVLALPALMGVYSFLTHGTPGTVDEGVPMGTATHTINLVMRNIVDIPTYIEGVMGAWPLGWNDTVMPAWVPVLGVMSLGALFALGLRSRNRSNILAVAIALAAFVAAPLSFLVRERLFVGEVVQPRYLAPLLLLAVCAALFPLGRRGLPRVPLAILSTVMALGAILAWWVVAHRYEFGARRRLFTLEYLDPAAASSLIGPPIPLSLTAFVMVVSTLTLFGSVWYLATAHGAATNHAPSDGR